MKLTDVAIMDAYHHTAWAAADKFAQEFFGDNSRKVGDVESSEAGLRFRLVEGTKWYRVTLKNCKYLIQREDETP